MSKLLRAIKSKYPAANLKIDPDSDGYLVLDGFLDAPRTKNEVPAKISFKLKSDNLIVPKNFDPANPILLIIDPF